VAQAEHRQLRGQQQPWLSRIESASGGFAATFALLLGWIFARNLLEGIFESSRQIGFDWREDVSFPMVFLHFPLYYLALWSWLCLLLRWLTGRPLANIVRAVTLAFGVIVLPPLIDGLLAPGRGYDLKYLTGFGPVLWRLWDPSHALQEVSPGQRVEIALACLLAAAYTAVAQVQRPRSLRLGGRERRNGALAIALSAAAAALGLYLIAAALGAWPSWYARLVHPGLAPAEAWVRVFRGPGLIDQESRRLAVLMALPVMAAAPLLARLADPRKFHAALRYLGWTRLLHYSGLVPAGALVAFLLYRDHLPWALRAGSDAPALLVLWSAMACAYLASVWWNDRFDVEADQINAPGRPIASGLVRPAEAMTWALAAAAAAVFLALCVSYSSALLVTACLFVSWIYSAPPLRLKARLLLSTLALATLSLLSAMTGFSLFAREMAAGVFPRPLAWLLLAGITLGFTAKDLKDGPGDRATGTVTLVTLLGEGRARRLSALLVLAGYLMGPLFFGTPLFFTLFAAALGAGAAVITLRVRRPDGILLLSLVVYVSALLFLLWREPRLLGPGAPEWARAHAWVMTKERAMARGGLGTGLPKDGPDRSQPDDERIPPTESSERRIEGWQPPAEEAGPGGPHLSLPGMTLERRLWLQARTDSEGAGARAVEELVSLRPLRWSYHEARMEGAARRGDIEGAMAACAAAVRLGVRPGDFLRNRAALCLASGDPRCPAERDLEGARRFGQREGLVLVLTGDERMRRSRVSEAVAAYTAATRREPGLPEAWAGLGQGLHAAGRLSEARDALRRAVGLGPQDAWAWNNLGVVERALGQRDAARQAFLRAVRLDPGLPEPRRNLADLDVMEQP